MFDKMKQLMEMKKQADRIKRELDALTVDVNVVNGIKLKINGSQDFQSVEIDQELLQTDNKQKFEADLLRSMNAAIQKSQEMAAQKMRSSLPAGFPNL